VCREKYLQHPKNFGVISQYLDRKSVSDCVQYYYLSKKTENYKQLLRKSRTRGTRKRPGNNPAGEVIAPNVTRVVTRRAVQELQQEKGGGGGAENNNENSNSSNKTNSRSNTPLPAGCTPAVAGGGSSSKQQQQLTEGENGEATNR
jgi:hypothetical protein